MMFEVIVRIFFCLYEEFAILLHRYMPENC